MKGELIYKDEAINAIRRRKANAKVPSYITRQETFGAGMDAAINAVASVPAVKQEK